MTILFFSPKHQDTLLLNQLNNFDAIWDVKVDWFEDPNERRGGWSGVGRVQLSTSSDKTLYVFLKRQENHERRTLRHPIKGEPTFFCEFQMIHHLTKHSVPTLKPVAFGQRELDSKLQAFLMTEELIGLVPLDQATVQLFSASRPTLGSQRAMVKQVASTVRLLHKAGVQHRSLYPKHLFVDLLGVKDAVVIDLEKSRIKQLPFMRSLYDLSTLNRHATYWSKSMRLYFYKQYLGVTRLNSWQKFLLKMIANRSLRKKIHKTVKKTYQGAK